MHLLAASNIRRSPSCVLENPNSVLLRERFPKSALHILAFRKPRYPVFGSRCFLGRVFCLSLPGLGLLGDSLGKLSLLGCGAGVQVLEASPKLLIGLGILPLNGSNILAVEQGNPGVDGGDYLLFFVADTVG